MTLSRIHGCVAALTLLLTATFTFIIHALDVHGLTLVLTVAVFAFIAWDPAASLLSAFLYLRRQTKDFDLTVEDFNCAEDADTVKVAIVIPTMLINAATIEEVLQTLHEHRVMNRRGNLFFGLLTDFCDSATPTAANDQELLQRVITGIDALNALPDSRGERFFLLHRARKWSALQQCWLGHERKRGKLRDFNQYLLTGSTAPFAAHAGPISALRGARLVVTLDEDNRCCDDAAYKLTRRMLQQTLSLQVDPSTRVVARGHALLQPYISARIDPSTSTRYQRLWTSGTNEAPPLDYIYSLYSGKWPYVGKGVYCVDTFERVMEKRFPNDWILSHDNVEGFFLGCGPAPDVELTEEHPPTIPHELMRMHRWIRGDVQVLPWMLPRVPTEVPRSRSSNPLTAVPRLRIANTVKGIASACVGFTLVFGGQLMSAASSALLFGVVTLMALPFLAGFATNVVRSLRKLPDHIGLAQCFRNASTDVARILVQIAIQPTTAFVTADAMTRAVWRMCISRRRMLEWRSAAAVATLRMNRVRDHVIALAPNYIASSTLLLAATTLRTPVTSVTLSLAVLWSSAPLLSWWLANPPRARRATM